MKDIKERYDNAIKVIKESKLNRDSIGKTIRGYYGIKGFSPRQVRACEELMYNIRNLDLATADLLSYTVAPYRERGEDTVSNVAILKDTMTIAIELFTIYNSLTDERKSSLKNEAQDEVSTAEE